MPTGPTNFPVSLDSFPTITPTTNEDDTGFEHDLIHNWAMTAIAALQTKVGVDGSTDAASLDRRVAQLESTGGAGTLVDLAGIGVLTPWR